MTVRRLRYTGSGAVMMSELDGWYAWMVDAGAGLAVDEVIVVAAPGAPGGATAVVVCVREASAPASSARCVSAMRPASALRSGTPNMLPAPAPGVSRPRASALMRGRSPV